MTHHGEKQNHLVQIVTMSDSFTDADFETILQEQEKKISPHDKKTRLQVLLLERSPISSKKEASNRMSTIREEERVPSLGWILQLVLAAREEGTKQSSPNL